MFTRNGATIRNIVEVIWETPPAHYDAHSKMLMTPETASMKLLDHRISLYRPKGGRQLGSDREMAIVGVAETRYDLIG